MEDDYWIERWQQGETGFHQNEINPYLRQYWHQLHLADSSQVFVPLCGKSRDMLWLREQGHAVLGVEISDIAVQSFFKENRLSPACTICEKFKRFEIKDLSILHGDFFDLNKEDLAGVGAVYDRASLVALPPALRKRYARHLVSILPAATQILLVTLDYPQYEMSGPPFAVSRNEVETLYQQYAEIQLLARMDVLEQNQRFRERGLSQLHESIFSLTLI